MAFGQKKKKSKKRFTVFFSLCKALSDDVCLTLKLTEISFNPFWRQPL